nr:hypothetical protein [Tanacetum cinerariifolium]
MAITNLRSMQITFHMLRASMPARGSNPVEARAIDVLLEEWPTTAGGESAETGTSVNRPESGRVSLATHVAPRGDEAGPWNQPPQGVPYPYHPEQVIRGDSVLFIERRLLSGQKQQSPTSSLPSCDTSIEFPPQLYVNYFSSLTGILLPRSRPRGDFLNDHTEEFYRTPSAIVVDPTEPTQKFRPDCRKWARSFFISMRSSTTPTIPSKAAKGDSRWDALLISPRDGYFDPMEFYSAPFSEPRGEDGAMASPNAFNAC